MVFKRKVELIFFVLIKKKLATYESLSFGYGLHMNELWIQICLSQLCLLQKKFFNYVNDKKKSVSNDLDNAYVQVITDWMGKLYS